MCPVLDFPTTLGVPPPKRALLSLPQPAKLPEIPQVPPRRTTPEKSTWLPNKCPYQVGSSPLSPTTLPWSLLEHLEVIYSLGLSLPDQRAASPGSGWVLLLSACPHCSQSCTEQALPSAGWKRVSLPPTLPLIISV